MSDLEEYIRSEVCDGESILVMNLHDLQEVLTRVSMNAIARYEAVRKPKSDRMKQGEAKRYIAERGFKPSMLKVWVEKGLIVAEKPCDTQNGAVWYSRAEIENVITSYGMTKVMMKDVLYKKKLNLN